MDPAGMCVVLAGTCRKFHRLPDNTGNSNMLTLVLAGMMHMFERKQGGLLWLPGAAAL